ncbi:hypothetical protein HNQ91_002757 [Filimonas zeae]|uniref:eCIS core domain-containing protein n=1 Tax=Filimonas zeae TaxID=1737353 RepID=A0A917IZJ2_9BACT|nr:DUF4157 domain-containing protein [Filimonas zeae]MDR6339692.1 hypothetical protein [Filimonas zeae]GGH69175.1 hypothetical protein GCM10011379_26230 [Filimonas zeae]
MKQAVLQSKLPDTAVTAGRSAGNPFQLLKEQAAQLMSRDKTAQLVAPEEELPVQGKLTAQLAAPEEELPLQGKFVAQLQAGPEEELPVQGKFTAQLQAPEEELPVQGKFAVQRVENKTGMPDSLKSGVESMSGYSMDNVRVHYNSDKPAQLNALAYAQGSDIHMGPGQEQHLPHEAWHVVQQMQGRVQPTIQEKGVGINDDVSLESEADVMGAKAAAVSLKRK